MATQKVTTPEILTSSVRAAWWGHAWNPNTLKIEAEESKQVGGQPDLHIKFQVIQDPKMEPLF